MTDFVCFTLVSGNLVSTRISEIVSLSEYSGGTGTTFVQLRQENLSYHVQESIEEILALIKEPRETTSATVILKGLTDGARLNQAQWNELHRMAAEALKDKADTFPPSIIPMPPPAPPGPPGCVRREAGTPWGPFCPICRSDMKRRFWLFGKLLGCINEDCKNYWRKSDDHAPDDA